jgi:hypothetical protein
MIQLTLTQPEHTIYVSKAGTYRLYLTGGFYVSGLEYFGIQLTQSGATKVILAEPLVFKQRVRLNGKPAVECFRITFSEKGEYHLSISNAEKISMKRSMLISRNFLFPKKVRLDEMEAIIELKR